jgi:hypothetical protein
MNKLSILLTCPVIPVIRAIFPVAHASPDIGSIFNRGLFTWIIELKVMMVFAKLLKWFVLILLLIYLSVCILSWPPETQSLVVELEGIPISLSFVSLFAVF